jgi:transcriptional regulator with XRE-family HTH domain
MSAVLLHFPDMKALPNRIREWREARGLSQQELADMAGCSKMQISGLERGRPQLDVHWMQRLAPHLGVTPGELLTLDDNPAAGIGPEEAHLLELFRNAPSDVRAQLLRVSEALTGYGIQEQQRDVA